MPKNLGRSRARIGAAGVGLSLAMGGGGDAAIPKAAPETVQTLAGPHCPPARIGDRSVNAAGSLALGEQGGVFFATGPPGLGWVAQADTGARGFRMIRFPVSENAVPGPASSERPSTAGPRSAHIAPDGAGGLIYATETAVFHRTGEGQPVTTLIGNAAGGEPQAGGPNNATAPAGAIAAMATDEAGNVFFAEKATGERNAQIRVLGRSAQPRVVYPGTGAEVTISATSIETLFSFDDSGIPDAREALESPAALSVAGSRLYVGGADSQKRAGIWMVNLAGAPLSTHGSKVLPAAMVRVASGRAGEADADDLRISEVTGLTADGRGNLWIADRKGNRVFSLDQAGNLSVFAGTGVAGFSGNDGPAVRAQLDGPRDVAVAENALVYISDGLNGQIRVVDQPGLIHAASGTGLFSYWACEHPLGPQLAVKSIPAWKLGPVSVTGAPGGAAYFGATAGRATQIGRVDQKGDRELIAGGIEYCPPKADCPSPKGGGPEAKGPLGRPDALLTKSDDGVYVLDGGQNQILYANLGSEMARVHSVSIPAKTLRPIAGTGDIGTKGMGGRALAAELSGAESMAADGAGNLFVAEPRARRISRVSRNGVLSPVIEAGDDEPADQCCREPRRIAADPAGNLYIADGQWGPIWFLNRSDTPVTIHGQRVAPGDATPLTAPRRGVGPEGEPARQAGFVQISALELDARGNLYIADEGEDTIRKIDPAGVITTLAGSGVIDFNGDNLKGRLTAMSQPRDIALDGCGNLLIADFGNNRVRHLDLGGECPEAQSTDESSGRGDQVAVVLAVASAVGLLVAGVPFVLRRKRVSHGPG